MATWSENKRWTRMKKHTSAMRLATAKGNRSANSFEKDGSKML